MDVFSLQNPSIHLLPPYLTTQPFLYLFPKAASTSPQLSTILRISVGVILIFAAFLLSSGTVDYEDKHAISPSVISRVCDFGVCKQRDANRAGKIGGDRYKREA
ncbi:hypothetical protein L1987_08318 [Smallanthus sonchifolius]|uniref:Uncharacterized protein n=1 Tax=Smallanthus sonchifolius TaxID=185202 RepID=A0ACB9JKE5_9ASTR|nr:hypothetical protein L1987_08318 [Smallanthus sonchifolius]